MMAAGAPVRKELWTFRTASLDLGLSVSVGILDLIGCLFVQQTPESWNVDSG